MAIIVICWHFIDLHRTQASSINKAHSKFFYQPVHRTHEGEEAILLDILFEANNYKNILHHEIKSGFLIATPQLTKVNIPSFEDLLGDKLTAFAPNTTGIPYFKKEDSIVWKLSNSFMILATYSMQ